MSESGRATALIPDALRGGRTFARAFEAQRTEQSAVYESGRRDGGAGRVRFGGGEQVAQQLTRGGRAPGGATNAFKLIRLRLGK